MRSKGKPAQTTLERDYVSKIAEQACVVCDATPVEIHEFEQGNWFTSVPVCVECHRGTDGWHGSRLRWKLRRIDMLEAINRTVGRAWAR